jgi:hypothetical protein
VTLAYQAERFGVFRDMAAMDKAEDANLGWAGNVLLGSYRPELGSLEGALFTQAQVTKGWSASDRNLLLLSASASGRRPAGGWEDGLLDMNLIGYWKETSHQVAAGHLELDAARRPDPEDLLYLGATQGLRGYPNLLHPGDATWVCSLDQRFLTDRRWLGILRLGFVAFADAGAIHRLDGAGWSPTYADLGCGLRLGDLKSSLGQVVYVTLGAPLVREPGVGRWQLAFGNIVQF